MDNKTNEVVEPTVSQKDIYTGKYISLKVKTVEQKKGYAQREIVQHSGSILLIPITEDDKIIMDRIYRKTIEEYSLELPTKSIKSLENHLDIIKTNMLETLGYETEEIRHLYDFYPALSYSEEKVYMYIARVKKIKDVHFCNTFSTGTISIDELDTLDILDAKTMIAINYLKENKNKLEV